MKLQFGSVTNAPVSLKGTEMNYSSDWLPQHSADMQLQWFKTFPEPAASFLPIHSVAISVPEALSERVQVGAN